MIILLIINIVVEIINKWKNKNKLALVWFEPRYF